MTLGILNSNESLIYIDLWIGNELSKEQLKKGFSDYLTIFPLEKTIQNDIICGVVIFSWTPPLEIEIKQILVK